jgi:hypothetical protein
MDDIEVTETEQAETDDFPVGMVANPIRTRL